MFNAALRPRGLAVALLKRHASKRHETRDHAARIAVPLFSHREFDRLLRHDGNPMKESNRFRYSSTDLERSLTLKHYRPVIEEEDNPKLHMLFPNREDTFAHGVFEHREAYDKTILRSLPFYEEELTSEEINDYLTKTWSLLPIEDIVEAFKRVSYFASKNEECIADPKYTRIVKYLVANARQLTDFEIGEVLKGLALWPLLHTRKDDNFKTLSDTLDKECVRRAAKWTVDELLLIADHWYKVRMARYSSFCSWVITKLASKANRLSPTNLVQLMFYANATRNRSTDMYNLEYRLESCIDKLDIQELAIVSLGFFKTQTPVRSPNLLVKMMERTMAEMETIDSISLAALLKIIGYSYRVLLDINLVPKLLMSTLPQVPRLSLLTLIHIITVQIKLRIFQPELLTAVAKRYSEEIHDARLKDIERVVLSLTVFNFTPDFKPNIFETVVDELRRPEREDEFKIHPKSLGRILRYLSVMNIYPKDLISTVLDPEYLKKFYGDSPYRMNEEILTVDLNVDVELEDYTGPRLDNKSRSIVAKMYVNKLQDPNSAKLSNRQFFLFQVLRGCEDIFGSKELVHVDWLLPQYRDADIVICLDEKNSPVRVKDVFSEMPFGDVKRIPDNYPEGYKWLAVIIATYNCFVKDTHNLLGKDILKLRQLEKIGYTPVVLPWYEWFSNDQDKIVYLKEKLYQS